MSGVKAPTSELVEKIVAKYNFAKFPKSIEELDLSKGIEFLEGSSGDYPIQKFAIWSTLLVLETRVDTNVSQSIIEEILQWAKGEFGINYSSTSIKRFGYISDVTFYSDEPILDVNPAVRTLARKCSEALTGIWQEPVVYEPFTVRVGHDPSARKNPIAPFMIEHRAETKFLENKYFSEAPLPTDMHWELLREFEKNMSKSRIPKS
jgi:hypothetical protein